MPSNSLQKAQLLCDAMPASMIVARRDGRLHYQNAGAVALSGFTADEIRERFIYEVFLRPGDASYEQTAKQMHARYNARRKGLSETYEIKVQRKDSTERYFEICAAPLILDGSSISGSIGAVRDVSEEKLLQQRFNGLFAEKELLRGHGARLAHDMRNMLFVINGRAELARKQQPQCQHLMDNLLVASSYTGELVERLQVVCRNENAKVADECDLHEEFAVLAQCIRHLAEPKVRVTTVKPTSALPARICGLQFRQAVMNMALNAFDSMPDGGTLHLSLQEIELPRGLECTTATLEPGRYARLEISDNGYGIPDFVQSRLFHSCVSTKSQGSGLGLYSVHQSIQSCGGAIQMSSLANSGTVFVLYIPIAG